ncbi:uncharacterized [Tachysurus ichikawai]
MLAEWCNGEQQAESDVRLSKTHTKTRLVHMAFEDYNWLGWMLPFSVSRVSVGCCCSAHAYWSAFNSLLPAVQVNTLVSILGSLIGLRTISGIVLICQRLGDYHIRPDMRELNALVLWLMMEFVHREQVLAEKT